MAEKKTCASCGKTKKAMDFYMSSNPRIHIDNRVPYCKECVKILSYNKDGSIDIEKFKDVLMVLDKPFLQDLFNSSISECEKIGSKDYIGKYMKSVALNHKFLTFKDGEVKTTSPITERDIDSDNEIVFTKNDEKNKNDVFRMLGYDPFETENEQDKSYLYNKLIDFLDESTLEDSFKLSAVIEIVKSFNQIEKINHALSFATKDVKAIAGNVGGIKSLFDAKEKILKSVLGLAKDNGISVNHNNNKSKGGNTLNGIVKKLTEIGLSTAELNLFDLETCEAMKQIADLSNKSILDQLMLDENDHVEMIAEQNEIIRKLDNKVIALEEENRLLKIKLKDLESD